MVAEFVRGDLEGNPWGTMGYTQARVLPMVQIAEWTGVYGVSFVLVAMNAALADVVVARAARGARSARSRSSRASLLALYAYGGARLAAVETEPPGDVPIAVVQGNVDLGARWREELYGENLGRLPPHDARHRARRARAAGVLAGERGDVLPRRRGALPLLDRPRARSRPARSS